MSFSSGPMPISSIQSLPDSGRLSGVFPGEIYTLMLSPLSSLVLCCLWPSRSCQLTWDEIYNLHVKRTINSFLSDMCFLPALTFFILLIDRSLGFWLSWTSSTFTSQIGIGLGIGYVFWDCSGHAFLLVGAYHCTAVSTEPGSAIQSSCLLVHMILFLLHIPSISHQWVEPL